MQSAERPLPALWAAFRHRRKVLLGEAGMRSSTAWKIADREARMRQTAAAMMGESEAMQALFLCRPNSKSNRLHFELIGNVDALTADLLAALRARAGRTKALILMPLAPAAG